MKKINREFIENEKLKVVLKEYPFLEEFLKNNFIEIKLDNSIKEVLSLYDEETLIEKGVDRITFIDNIVEFIKNMFSLLGIDEEENDVEKITIISGYNKSGKKESFDEFTIKKGEIIVIVGSTGSGKSRLLADIEWGAQNDTPTKRKILINGEIIDRKKRFSSGNNLVAQLSQNMNFIMDLSVYEFLELHAKSRMIEDEEIVINKIFEKANVLAGEKFSLEAPITSLSGGQSRALMIADTAILSKSPIVLIDEIENAGIDRKEALELLVNEDKIVLMSTHDPLLALMGDKRIVINNGGIEKIIEITDEEKNILTELEKIDSVLQNVRNKLRYGEKISL